MTILQPSSFLPSLRIKGQQSNTAAVKSALATLRTALDDIQLDDTERSFAQAWLTRLFTISEDDNLLDEAGELLALATQSLQLGIYCLPFFYFHLPLHA